MTKEKIDPIEVRLNAIIGLLSNLLLSQDKITKGSVYQTLNHAGLGPSEIGNIFGKGRGEIGKELNIIKKQKSKSKKGMKNDKR